MGRREPDLSVAASSVHGMKLEAVYRTPQDVDAPSTRLTFEGPTYDDCKTQAEAAVPDGQIMIYVNRVD